MAGSHKQQGAAAEFPAGNRPPLRGQTAVRFWASVGNRPASGSAGSYNCTMTPQQLEFVAGTAALALALVQMVKALLEVAALLAKRRRSTHRGQRRPSGRRRRAEVGRHP